MARALPPVLVLILLPCLALAEGGTAGQNRTSPVLLRARYEVPNEGSFVLHDVAQQRFGDLNTGIKNQLTQHGCSVHEDHRVAPRLASAGFVLFFASQTQWWAMQSRTQPFPLNEGAALVATVGAACAGLGTLAGIIYQDWNRPYVYPPLKITFEEILNGVPAYPDRTAVRMGPLRMANQDEPTPISITPQPDGSVIIGEQGSPYTVRVGVGSVLTVDEDGMVRLAGLVVSAKALREAADKAREMAREKGTPPKPPQKSDNFDGDWRMP